MNHWPDMIRRVQNAYCLTQAELADAIDADPAQLSKWVRAKHEPSKRIKQQLRRMLLKHDPSLSHDAIRLSPVAQAVLKMDVSL